MVPGWDQVAGERAGCQGEAVDLDDLGDWCNPQETARRRYGRIAVAGWIADRVYRCHHPGDLADERGWRTGTGLAHAESGLPPADSHMVPQRQTDYPHLVPQRQTDPVCKVWGREWREDSGAGKP